MKRYIVLTSIFFFIVGGFYLKYLNYRQEKEAERLGVPVKSRSKWTTIDDKDPRCSPELGHAYRLTNRLMTLNMVTFIGIFTLMTQVDW